jgi:hypothetical protein
VIGVATMTLRESQLVNFAVSWEAMRQILADPE